MYCISFLARVIDTLELSPFDQVRLVMLWSSGKLSMDILRSFPWSEIGHDIWLTTVINGSSRAKGIENVLVRVLRINSPHDICSWKK